jgi:hypothetical protein
MSDIQPPLEYLVECSNASLESFELSRLNRASNLQKEQSQLTEERIQAEVSLRLARLILDRRRLETSSSELRRSKAARFEPRAQLDLVFVPQLGAASDAQEIDCALSRISQEQRIYSDSRPRDSCIVANEEVSTKCRRHDSQINAHLESLTNQSTMIQKRGAASPTRSVVSCQATTELFALETYALGPPEPHSLPVKQGGDRRVLPRKIEYRLPLRILAPPDASNWRAASSPDSRALFRATRPRAQCGGPSCCERRLASAS